MGLFDEIKDKLTGHDDDAEKAAAAAAAAQQASEQASHRADEIASQNTPPAVAPSEPVQAAPAVAPTEMSAHEKHVAHEAHMARTGGGDDRTYTVEAGDTLSAIGAKFGVSWKKIAEVNDIANPDLIHPGQVFKIPSA